MNVITEIREKSFMSTKKLLWSYVNMVDFPVEMWKTPIFQPKFTGFLWITLWKLWITDL